MVSVFNKEGIFICAQTDDGFTLLESILTIIIMLVSGVSIFYALGQTMVVDANSERTMVALHLAQEEMEQIKDATTYANVDTFVSSRMTLDGSFSFFDREVTIVASDPKQADVIVYWQEKGIDQNIQLTTLIADYGY